jgi:hypothetical protein
MRVSSSQDVLHFLMKRLVDEALVEWERSDRAVETFGAAVLWVSAEAVIAHSLILRPFLGVRLGLEVMRLDSRRWEFCFRRFSSWSVSVIQSVISVPWNSNGSLSASTYNVSQSECGHIEIASNFVY